MDKKMIELIDLINLSGVSLSNFKIHCGTGKISQPAVSLSVKRGEQLVIRHNYSLKA